MIYFLYIFHSHRYALFRLEAAGRTGGRKMKKKCTVILLIVAMILLTVALVSCGQGVSPVQNIVVTSLPVTNYYVGDSFVLGDAKLSVYYENGTVETITIDSSMISSFDSNVVGDQILTVSYGDKTTQVRVHVSMPPIYSVRIADTDYKKSYVIGQELNLTDVYVEVVYTNNHVERIPVTADMVEGFDSSTAGEKDVVVSYEGYTPAFRIKVVPRAINQINVGTPTKRSYVIDQEIDFTGSTLFLSYNDNSSETLLTKDLYDSGKIAVKIDGEEKTEFDRASELVYVTVVYEGHEDEFFVSVHEVVATKLEWTVETVNGKEVVHKLKDQPKNSPTPDLSDAKVHVEYNNGNKEDIDLDDSRIEIRWGEFDISRTNKYLIKILVGGTEMEYVVSVVEPVEKEILIFLPDTVYYQDGPEIDMTEWSYSLRLTNGQLRSLGSDAASKPNFTRNGDGSINYGVLTVTDDFDLSTTEYGDREFTFYFTSTDMTVNLKKTVTVTVHRRVLTGITDFVLPTRTVYYPDEEIELEGGSFVPVYNDGTTGDPIDLTADMLGLGIGGYTSSVGAVSVDLSYTDSEYTGTIEHTFEITVVKRATVSYNADLSVGLKTNYILGETFDPTNLVVGVRYSDGGYTNFTDFSGGEWSFEDTHFSSVGASYVKLYYGARGAGTSTVYTRIPVVVTNNIASVRFDDVFEGFGQVVEGLELSIPATAQMIVTRENGDETTIKVTRDMTDYRSSNMTLGEREVNVSYQGFVLTSAVEVVARSISSVEIYSLPAKRQYIKADNGWDLTGLIVRVYYDNGTTINLVGTRMTYIRTENGIIVYSTTASGRSYMVRIDALVTGFTTSYNEQSVTVSVTDAAARGTGKSTEFVIYCFEKLIKELTFGTTSEGDGAVVYCYEAEEFAFPADAYIKVTYSDNTSSYASGQEFDKVELLNYDKNVAGFHSVTASYLLSECNVSVFTWAKILSSVSVTPESPDYVSLIEGVPLSADVLNVHLHFVRYDNTPYATPYDIDVEFGNVTSCTYDENADFFFDHSENGNAYHQQQYTLTYRYVYKDLDNGDIAKEITREISRSADFIVRTYKKKAVSITMQVLPQSEYLEGESILSLYTEDDEPGKVLVTYDNGSSVRYDLDNNLVSVSPRLFDGSEIPFGSAPRRQRVTVTFHDGNNQISTEYYVTIKDREYLTIDYFQNPTDGIYTFRYGAAASNRPGFNLQGYAMNAANNLVLTTLATTQAESPLNIDLLPEFQLYYLDENSVKLYEFPKNVGLYQVVVSYSGDTYNNAFVDDSRYVRILPKELTLTVLDKSVVYGDAYDVLTVTAVDGADAQYRWTVSDDAGRTGQSALAYSGETVDEIAEITCAIYQSNLVYEFFTVESTGRTIYCSPYDGATVVGEYEIRPALVTQLSDNYSFKKYVSGALTIEKKEIKIVALPISKEYGDNDPRLNNYEVYEINGPIETLIGGAGSVNLDGGNRVDSIATYTLYRQQGDNYELVGSYELSPGSASAIANYELVEYDGNELTINRKHVTIVGTQRLTRYYGHNPAEDQYSVEMVNVNGVPQEVRTKIASYQEYSFALKAGSSMARSDRFDTIFASLIDYRQGAADEHIKIDLSNGGSTDFANNVDVGTYTVSVSILTDENDLPIIAGNYDVTVEDFSFTIVPEPVTVTITSYSVNYLDYASLYWSEKANWDALSVNATTEYLLYGETGRPYTLSFSAGYVLEEEDDPVFEVLKEKGYDVGKYLLTLDPDSIAFNSNYLVTVTGDFETFVEEDVGESFYLYMSVIPTENRGKSYLVILPNRFDYVRATEEVYGKNVSITPEIDVDYNFDLGMGEFRDFILGAEITMKEGFRFTLRNDTASRSGAGYYTADTYSGVMNYNYFANAVSKNFYPSSDGLDEESQPIKTDLSFDSMLMILKYVYFGTTPSVLTYALTMDISYEITPILLDIYVQNSDCFYTGARQIVSGREVPDPMAIELSSYQDDLCEGDSLSFGYSISVQYYSRSYEEGVFDTTDMVYHSGLYKVYLTGVGNYNYALSDLSTIDFESARTFTVRPIDIDIFMPNADEHGYVHSTYNGKAVRSNNMNWQAVTTNPGAINGYFTGNSGQFRIVNNSGLAAAPKNLRIDPITYEDGVAVNPKNANKLDGEGNVIDPYDYVWSVNDNYVNMSVRFVKVNPAYNGNNDYYIEGVYKFVIDPASVRLGNFTNGKVNFKNYDGREPAMANVDKIIVDGELSADRIDKNRLSFSFARDMDYVPEQMRTIITEDDMTSAGYFFIYVSYENADGFSNYTFVPESEYYVIRRLAVGVTLNGDEYYLRKEFDTLAPSAVKAEFKSLSTVRDDVLVDLETRYYHAMGDTVWSSYSSVNNVGVYAYNFKPYVFVPGVGGQEKFYLNIRNDETTGYRLLSWNYCYYFITVSGIDTNGCDGLYYINKKNVSLSLPGAYESNAYYVYPRTYDSLSVTAAQATAEMSNAYTVLDRTGQLIEEATLVALGFDSVNGTSGGVRNRAADIQASGENISKAGETFSVSFTALANKNPNFNITNKEIQYAIVKLEVGINLRYENGDGNAEMVYGTVIMKEGSGINYQIFDFHDIEAFAAAIHSTPASVGSISDWLSEDEGDSETKFVFQGSTRYYLVGNRDYNLAEKAILDAGDYTANLTGLYSANYSFRIYGDAFTIQPKPISITGASRDYFDKGTSRTIDWSIDGNVNLAVENRFMDAVLSYFEDGTALNTDAGDYLSNNYYVAARRNDIEEVKNLYPNYTLNVSEVFPANYEANKVYLKLTVKKLPLTVAMRGPDGGILGLDYGQSLTDENYMLTYVGFPALTASTEYQYSVELNKQNEVKSFVKTQILNVAALSESLRVLNASEIAYSDYALEDYAADLPLTNFEVSFDSFVFFINPIILQLQMRNPAANAGYDAYGRFSIIYDEISLLRYSETETGRLNYYFTIENPTAIVGYVAGMNLVDMLNLVLVSEMMVLEEVSPGSGVFDYVYKSRVAYEITKQGSNAITAGECQIKLTDNWYSSINYKLECRQTAIMVYPVVSYIGDDATNSLPYSAISLTGAEEDYLTNIKRSLSMLVKFTYNGMPAGEEIQWIDVGRPPDAEFYDGCDYSREFTIAFSGGTPDSLKVGDIVALKLTYFESFYSGQRENTIVTPEFWVRIYAGSDAGVKYKDTTDFATEDGTAIQPFNKDTTTDGRYYATTGKGVTSRYSGQYDIVSTDFYLNTTDSDGYSFGLILFENTEKQSRLVLRFDGGTNYGYYAQLTYNGVEYAGAKIKTYTYYDAVGHETVADVRELVNLFDGRRHAVVAYIDKVGSPDFSTYDTENLGDNTYRLIMNVYYTVTFEIDGRYVFKSKYLGGKLSRTFTVNMETGELNYTSYVYADYVGFAQIASSVVKVFEANDGNVGFVTEKVSARFLRFTLKTMGVSMSRNGANSYVQDVRINPSSEGTYILYVEEGTSVSSAVNYFVVNSGDGYGKKSRISFTYYDPLNGLTVDPSAPGLYVVSAAITVDGVVRSNNFYLCIVEEREATMTLAGSLISHDTMTSESAKVYADTPLNLYNTGGGYAFTESYATSIDYTRFVFDYSDDGTGVNPSTLRLILKSTDNTKVDLSDVDESEGGYRGISLEINRVFVIPDPANPVEVLTFETILHVRDGIYYWNATYMDIDWVGEKNILVTRYDYANGVVEIRLVRDGVTLFNEKIRAGSLSSGLSSGGSSISSTNIRNVIGDEDSRGGYVGMHMRNAEMVLYELRLTEPKASEYTFIEKTGAVIDADVTITPPANPDELGNSYLLSDSHGVATAFAEKSVRLVFSATGGDSGSGFRLMFNNNTPYFFNGTIDDQLASGDRGMGILVTTAGVYVSPYKYDIEWSRQAILSANLLDGEEHVITVRVTDTRVTSTIGAYVGVTGYQIVIYIDGIGYNAFAPLFNNLNEIITNDLGSGADPEVDGAYDLLRDEFFLSDSHYVGVYNTSAFVQIKEIVVF